MTHLIVWQVAEIGMTFYIMLLACLLIIIMSFILKYLRQQCVFQSLFAKQHPIATTRALAPMENVNVHLDGTPKLTVLVSTKISKLRACVSTGNSQHHVWHLHILRL